MTQITTKNETELSPVYACGRYDYAEGMEPVGKAVTGAEASRIVNRHVMKRDGARWVPVIVVYNTPLNAYFIQGDE